MRAEFALVVALFVLHKCQTAVAICECLDPLLVIHRERSCLFLERQTENWVKKGWYAIGKIVHVGGEGHPGNGNSDC